MAYQFQRCRLNGSTLKLTREQWDEVEIALGMALNSPKDTVEIHLVRDAAGNITSVATIGEDT